MFSISVSHKAAECSEVEPKEAETKESVHAKESSKDTSNRFLRFRKTFERYTKFVTTCLSGMHNKTPDNKFRLDGGNQSTTRANELWYRGRW
jgi:hypothetical protein